MEMQIPFETAVDTLMSRLKEKGYSKSYIENSYEIDLRKLKRHLEKGGSMMYTKELGDEFIAAVLLENVCQNRKDSHKRTIRHLNEILDGDGFHPVCAGIRSLQKLNGVLELFKDHLYMKGLMERTISDRVVGAFYFLGYLETCGIEELSMIRPEAIYSAYNKTAGKRLFSATMPIFLRFIYKAGLVEADYSGIVPRTVIPKTVPSVYTEDEIRRVMECIDRDTDIGKRDYAVFLLQARYGIRSGDIVRLGFANIDFPRKRIDFVQSKTAARIIFPMDDGISEALRVYIDGARPPVHSEFLFLRSVAPYTALTSVGCSSIARHYFKKSGIDLKGRRHGGHALRSSLASNLVNSGIAYTSVQNILGHGNINTVQEYAKIDLERLRICALEVPLPTGNLKAFLCQEGGGEA